MRWLDKSGHPIPGHPKLPVENAAGIKIWTSISGTPGVTGGKSSRNKEGPGAFGSVATFEPGPTGTLSYEHKQPLIAGKNGAGHSASDADAG